MKKILSVIAVIVGVLIVGFIVLSLTIDGIVKSNIESIGSEMLKTSVEVDDVGISILDGSGTIDGIIIHNPEGFSDNPAVKLQQISMKFVLSTLLSDTVVITDIEIKRPELYFEQKATRNNLNTLKNNLGGETSAETNVVVDHLLVENGLVRLSADIGGEETTAQAEFERFELTGIGRQDNNTMDQTMQQILEPILAKAIQVAIREGLLDLAKDKLQDLLDG
jgi:uncharacterized protein involved in outer membrane biogenesis